MTMNDPLANALSKILNTERIAGKECIVMPSSKTIKKVFEVMQDNRYIGGSEEIKDEKGDMLKVSLIGKINRCGVIKPRFSVTKESAERLVLRYLPARDFGILVISTSQGILSHKEAIKKGIGGKLLAYCY